MAGLKEINKWSEKRAAGFHLCADSRKIIWPFTLAYHTDYIDLLVRLQMRSRSAPRWLTSEAYMMRKLQGKEL